MPGYDRPTSRSDIPPSDSGDPWENQDVKRSIHLAAAMLSIAALTFGAAGPAFAGPATDTVKSKQTVLLDLLKQSTPNAQKKISALFDSGRHDPTRRRASSRTC
jgi:hypothetical protein